jgi:hypothetical protein
MSRKRTLSALVAAATAIIAVAAIILSACGAGTPSTASRPPQRPASPPQLHPPLGTGRAYRRAVEVAIARALHTPLGELQSKLRSQVVAAPGSDLMGLAKPLGFAQDQLGRIVLASLDQAADAAVRSGRWTPNGARKEKRYWKAQPAPRLIAEVSRWLGHG